MKRFLSWLWWHLSGQASIDKMLDDFEQKFPGQCPICSYHRYGVMEGHEGGGVAPHDCPERAR